MQWSRALLLLALVALVPCLTAQDHGHHASDDSHAAHSPSSPPAAHQPVGSAAPSSGHGTSLADAPAPAEEKKGFNGMYFGILTTFVILFTIFLFLYFFEYELPGDAYFYSYSYFILILVVCSGLSSYFTSSILAGLLATSILLTIAFAGFMAMTTVSSPDRFEGDKSNMGRTKLD